jgi:hypothetical protein
VSQAPQIKCTLVIDEIIDFISDICAPPGMKTILQAFQKKDSKAKEDAYTDYESLREIICTTR